MVQLIKLVNRLLSNRSVINSKEESIRFNPTDNEFVKKPYPVFEKLREQQPICKTEMGAWVLSCYEDVVYALNDSRFSNAASVYSVINSKNRGKYVCADVASNTLPFIDPPDHSILRKVISRCFFNQLKSSNLDIQKLSDSILDKCADKKSFDLISDFTTPFSIAVIAGVVGIPEKDWGKLKEWSHWFFYLFTYIPSEEIRIELDEKLKEVRAYLSCLIQEKKITPGDDFISLFLQDDEARNRLNESVLIDNCMLLIADGIENVDKGIASVIYTLMNNPEQYKLLMDDPSLIDNAIDECLRFESPAMYIGRIANEEIKLGNKVIKKNDVVLLLLSSANRDATIFESPDELNIKRDNGPSLSFGKGRHSCIGARLVKMEMEAVVLSMMRKFSEHRLVTVNPDWMSRPGHRWLKELYIQNIAIG